MFWAGLCVGLGIGTIIGVVLICIFSIDDIGD